MTCIIVDDEPLAGDLIESFVRKVSNLTLIGRCYSADEALELLEIKKIDLIFLDITLPTLSGLEVPHLIDTRTKIVYITAHREFALDAFSKNAVDYLLKPVTFDRFLQAVDKAKKAIASPAQQRLESEDFFVKSGTQLISVALEEVLYIEGMKDYVILHRANDKVITSKRMKDLEQKLADPFYRVHLSYIINIRKVTKIEDNHIFIGAKRIPISAKYRTQFLKAIDQKLF